jgi:hypothetical protein
MTMRWDAAGGSMVGRDHARAGRNNQDAFAVRRVGDAVAAAVCDGCGAAAFSEWGARLGAELTAAALARRAHAPWDELWEPVHAEVLAGLLRAAELIGDAHEHLLFTIVAALARGGEAAAAAIGDGTLLWDGATLLGRDEDDTPAYLGHALDGGAERAFRVLARGPCTQIALGTDGASAVAVPPLCDDELVWKNPDGLRRRLARAEGIHDDATLVLLRRTSW